MSTRFAPLFVALAVLTGSLAGCAQGRGETCQLSSDCEGSLTCCKTSSSPAVRGTCEERCTDVVVDAGRTDAGTGEDGDASTDEDVDAGSTDAGEVESDAGDTDVDAGGDEDADAGADVEDAGVVGDAGADDAGADDAGGADAGDPDAGEDPPADG